MSQETLSYSFPAILQKHYRMMFVQHFKKKMNKYFPVNFDNHRTIDCSKFLPLITVCLLIKTDFEANKHIEITIIQKSLSSFEQIK